MAALVSLASANLVVGSTSAAAQLDPATRGKMEYLHRDLTIAEENLSLAIRDKDFTRASLVNALLSNWSSDAHAQKLAANPCLEALNALGVASVAVGFAIHPITPGDDLGSMTKEELRFSKAMRPADEMLEKWYAEGSATYRTKISGCEQEIGAVRTARSLPDTLLRN